MEPEMDLVRRSDGVLYEKLLQIADRFSQNPDAVAWTRPSSPTVFSFAIRIGDEKFLQAQRKERTTAEELSMQMIQALDEYEALGHSQRILRPRRKPSQHGPSTVHTTDDEVTSDEESVTHRQDRLRAKVLELEPQMRKAVAAEREQYRRPLLHGLHLKHLGPRLLKLKTTLRQTDD